MKKIILATALFAAMSFATDTTKTPVPVFKLDTAKLHEIFQIDTAKLHEIFKLDTAKLHELVGKLPDSIKVKVDALQAELVAKRAEFKDTLKVKESALKLTVDSLIKTWEAKRDSQVAKIKDTDVRVKVQARIVEIDAKKAEVKAKIEAKKAEIEAKIEAKKAAKTTK